MHVYVTMDFHNSHTKKHNSSWKKLIIYGHLLFKTNAFFAYNLYFLSLSFLGFGILKTLKPRADFTPRNIDMFFTSVSAATVSSMSVVEMEVFSNAQLIVMTALMFIGGEVFTSMIRLHLKSFNLNTKPRRGVVESVAVTDHHHHHHRSSSSTYRAGHGYDQIELSVVRVPHESGLPNPTHDHHNSLVKYDSIKLLSCLVLSYLLAIHIVGIASVLIYLALVSSARNVLRNKGIEISTFAVFSIVSTFASCGFIPTNENMVVFSKNSGLLLILIPQILLGNTLFPSALRLLIWIVGLKFKKVEAKYLLENSSGREIGFVHLLPRLQSLFLAATVIGFILIGFVLFWCMERNTAGLDGLNVYQKLVAIIFQCANARHSGESILDLSTLAPAILVFFILMMYLPPYTTFLPVEKNELQTPSKSKETEKQRNKVIANLVFSQLSYLAISIILICITERESLKEDPLNFNVLNITLEVISAYGNVGFTTGYSCDRQLKADPKCVNKWFGFSGKWSDEGKMILILVMFLGRMKQFNMKGGRAWILL